MNSIGKELLAQITKRENDISYKQDSILRNRIHLMAPVGWLNDPNGLCQMGDTYHIFFQYAPMSAKGSGPKGWGHYITKDWCHYEYLGMPLMPDEAFDKDGVYSGSSLTDKDGMHIFYTGNVKLPGDHDYTTSGRMADTILVESKDGIHFGDKQVVLKTSDYPAGLSCHVRDPKVWEKNGLYYMVLGARTLENEGRVLLYRSENRKDWILCSVLTTKEYFGYMWECPDLFAISDRQILSVSPQGLTAQTDRFQNQYQSGYFLLEGRHAEKKEDEIQTIYVDSGGFTEWDKGFDFYAPQTFIDQKGRRILIGWAGMPDAEYTNKETLQEGWQHCLTFPRELILKENPYSGETQIYQKPIDEIMKLHTGECIPITQKTTQFENECMDLLFIGLPESFVIVIADGVRLAYRDQKVALSLTEECGSGRTIRKIMIPVIETVRILVDSSILEIYLNDGEMVFTTRYYKKTPGTILRIDFENVRGLAYPLQAITVNDKTESDGLNAFSGKKLAFSEK